MDYQWWLEELTSHAVAVFGSRKVLYISNDITPEIDDEESSQATCIFISETLLLVATVDFASRSAESKIHRVQDINGLTVSDVPNLFDMRMDRFPEELKIKFTLPGDINISMPLTTSPQSYQRRDVAMILPVLVAGCEYSGQAPS
ncbi:hypothetical protein SAMN04489740_0832 [Arthrobacter alpinus]|uniref:Uncharacterized protein n=2 Tax=Arthrobacter alpinus TaxID=656366 RepID=A0A1H5GRJ5_9MICC|nr:hypothetical protein SAMN04489740_0832 [Arthrobacter alpinus]